MPGTDRDTSRPTHDFEPSKARPAQSDQGRSIAVSAGDRAFTPQALCLDIETAFDDPLDLRKLAAWRCDTDNELSVASVREDGNLAEKLDALTEGAAFLVGHNVLHHDLPVLKSHFPNLRLHALPVIDTLLLSPLAFPQNPYHRLVKNYKLVRDARSDPLRDACLAFQLWKDQFQAFAALNEQRPEEVACYHYLLTRNPAPGLDNFFALVRQAPPPGIEEVGQAALALVKGKVCTGRIRQLLDDCLVTPDRALPLAYVMAWLRVSGGNSVIPPWVRHSYPFVRELLRQLRDTPCAAPDCNYCRERLNPARDLKRYFGFDAFRDEPRNERGGSLQEDIVHAVYAGQSLLAILPTSGGKSICYQLPGLSRHWRNGGLTVIVSPLQSLMKDQVDNLIKRGIYNVATLNGMLSMPERRDVLERIRLGDIGIVLVSPEQFRNKGFVEAIRYREIGAWVFDEAHCLSKWGNDFRPDYLYVARFIRERNNGDGLAPVCCFTATARREVVEDLRKHFRDALGVELDVFDGGHERENLHYEVMKVTAAEKLAQIAALLEYELKGKSGGAVVFVSQRKRCEEIAAFLKDLGWACAAFHGGLKAESKKDIQHAFIDGSLQVIAATNAFGMGVDKPDVRIVIHADIPGSLENYLQEAGRAGRDRQESRCVLLYDEEDVEAQFSLAAYSRLSRRDIAGILRSLRRYSARTKDTEIVLTPGEILADEQMETAIEASNPDADTKVRTAIAWLERARFLQRNENHVRVFPGSLRVDNLEAAEKRLARANLSREMRGKYIDLLRALINADDNEGISTDDLMLQLGIPANQCARMLYQLAKLGILADDTALTVLLRKGVKSPSAGRLARLIRLEEALLDLLPELAPDAAGEGWQTMELRALCHRVKGDAGIDCVPDDILTLMRSLGRPFGEYATARALFDIRVARREVLHVKLLRDWANIRQIAALRRKVAAVLLRTLLARLEPHLKGVDLRVACKLGELGENLRRDTEVGPVLRDELRAIEAGLLYLHDNGVLIIDRGKGVFRSAMTLRLIPSEAKRRFSANDFTPLKDHYAEKNFQVHVIQEYARLGLAKLSDALAFVMAYFGMPQLEFIRRYFAGRREILERATTAESWRRIVDDLRHPLQERIVAAGADGNRLLLAGPGSGKTRVIVHRIAYLVRVLREPARSIVALTFNRAAAWEVRQRLYSLIGRDAALVTVLTYHALALRLTGSSLAGLAAQGVEVDFEAILDRALALLEKDEQADSAIETDDLRERLLAGYRHILVDEYQDIDERQYRLISAMAGRQLQDRDAKLTLLAVGDDDQNVYAFRATSNEFITRFQSDYGAVTDYLVENYRSCANIIAAANRIIAGNRGRLKVDHPIRINHGRQRDPAGGQWQQLDTVVCGRVHVVAVPDDLIGQAEAVMAELRRIKSLDAGAVWSDFAVLARNRASLEPIRAWCELEGVNWCSPNDRKGQPRVTQTREGCALLDLLAAKPRRSLRTAALARWFTMRFRGGRADNPWQGLVRQFIDELQGDWPQGRVPSAIIVDTFHEFGYESHRSEYDHLVLSTVHGAKGREFCHVAILDGGEWKRDADDERRLYYVGMTRARENLILCQSSVHPNPFSPTLEGDEMVRISAPALPERRPQLSRRYLALDQGEIFLGYAGRFAPTHPVSHALSQASYGDELKLVINGDWRELRTLQGIIVGKLAHKTALPAGHAVRITIESIMRWSRERTGPDYRDRLQADEWWVVLPRIVIEPAGDR